MKNTSIKVNLHICEHCNYHCRHCFAKFESKQYLRFEHWEKIVKNVLRCKDVTEINIAGGEPLLHPELMKIVDLINSRGVPVSIITNGSLVTDSWIRNNSDRFSTIGFSVDTVDRDLQVQIGRCTACHDVVSAEDFERKIGLIKAVSDKTKVKVNTVVNNINKDDDLAKLIKTLNADRWKILKMQVFQNGQFSNKELQITDDEYNGYVQRALQEFGTPFSDEQIRYCSGGTEIIAEKTLRGTYIMIDANGFLVDNTKGLQYTKVCDCKTDDFSEGLQNLNLNVKEYLCLFSGYSELPRDN